MKFSILSALAIAMAGTASAVPGFVTNLARASTEIKSSSALGGRVEIKIDGVSANFLSPQCLSVLEDAFGTAYQQMYGNDSMVGTVVAGSAVVEDDGNRKAADDHLRDHYVYPGYRHWIVFDYDCHFCHEDDDPPIHSNLEELIVAIVNTSPCDAFESVESVNITDKATDTHIRSTSGAVTIELDHIFVGELSESCEALVGYNFVSAFNKIFGTTNDMLLDIVSTDKKRTGARLGDWSYQYNLRTFWHCKSCDRVTDLPGMLKLSRKSAFEKEFLTQLASSSCAAFQTLNGLRVTDVPVSAHVTD